MTARPGYGIALACALLGAIARPAGATYSIAAVDGATRQVGGAGASCVGGLSVRIIYGVAPGVGVVHAQASVNTDGRDEAVSLLERGQAPADILDALTAPEFDPFAEQRQYGVVDLDGRAAGFTGAANGDFAGDRQGEAGTFTYTVQGNILTGEGVIERAAAAFEGGGCDLADRLMRALEAGAESGEGDSRCTPDGVPADSGFLEVDLPDGQPGSYLRLEVTDTGTTSPVVLLRQQYDEWRAENPCPSAADAGPDADAGSSDGGPAPGGDASSAGADDGSDSGCGCRTGGGASALPLLLALAAVLAIRARR